MFNQGRITMTLRTRVRWEKMKVITVIVEIEVEK